jgi:hypothetical protein
MCYVVGRAVATGFSPEAGARHMVINKPQGHLQLDFRLPNYGQKTQKKMTCNDVT